MARGLGKQRQQRRRQHRTSSVGVRGVKDSIFVWSVGASVKKGGIHDTLGSLVIASPPSIVEESFSSTIDDVR